MTLENKPDNHLANGMEADAQPVQPTQPIQAQPIQAQPIQNEAGEQASGNQLGVQSVAELSDRGARRRMMSPQFRARNILSLTRDLIRVLEQENEALDQPQVVRLSPIVREKEALFQLLDEELEGVDPGSSFLSLLPEDLRTELSQTAAYFDELLKINERKLSLSLRVSRAIADQIAAAVRKVRGEFNTYGASGKAVKSSSATSVSMNMEL